MKILINKCTNPLYWYKNAIGNEIQCLTLTGDGEALISSKIVNEIDGDDDQAAGYVLYGDFTIVQEDNRLAKLRK